jgi:hypothetical protein
MPNSPLSPFAENIRHAFEFSRACGKSALFVFWDAWEDKILTPAVDKGAYPWAVHDEAVARNPNARLCLAFDLARPFAEQFPLDRFSALETPLALSVSPVIWIADRSGKIPARERAEFEREALRPSLRIVR